MKGAESTTLDSGLEEGRTVEDVLGIGTVILILRKLILGDELINYVGGGLFGAQMVIL